MANNRLHTDLMQEAVNLVAKHGSVTAAAVAIGMPRNTMDSRVQAARRAGLRPTVEPVQVVDEHLSTIIENLRAENDRLRGELAQATDWALLFDNAVLEIKATDGCTYYWPLDSITLWKIAP